MRKSEFTVSPEEAGERLDAFLARHMPGSSRTFFQKLIREGNVLIDGGAAPAPRTLLRTGVRLTVEMPDFSAPAPPAAEPFAFPILYEDDVMLVIDKPAGVVVHPAVGNPSGTVLNALLSRAPELAAHLFSNSRPGIVHRLDKDTSGCLVTAKTPDAQFLLGRLFADRKVSKTYLALVRGVPARRSGEIVTLIGRHPVNRQKMAVVERNGREAVTFYETVASGNADGLPFSLLKVRIATGRTHQIRVHMNHLGHPVLGDQVYGGAGSRAAGAERQMLHAWRLELPHPVTGAPCVFKAPLPEDFRKFLDFLPPELLSGLN